VKIHYRDLVEQTFDFPNEEFSLNGDKLEFHGIPLNEVAEKYGTPLKITYLPKITSQIERARKYFRQAMEKSGYRGTYDYCYCTKSSHFSFVLEEILSNGAHIETSSAYDVDIIDHFLQNGTIGAGTYVVCNGYKTEGYVQKIAHLINDTQLHVIPVLDNKSELFHLSKHVNKRCHVGIRIASEEAPKFEFYTSRLGIGYKDIVPYYLEHLQHNHKFELKLLHFFINTGITDTAYYWSELAKCVRVYCSLKKVCPTLDTLDIGGGLPIRNSLNFNYDYEYMIDEIVLQIKSMCNEEGVEEPNLITEFGSFTVGESGAVIYSVIDQKKQNDREKWNMIDSSFMTTLPDSWAINKRFIMLAVNNWDEPYERVFLGGLTCDSDDYYNSEQHSNAIYLPRLKPGSKQYIGFFHTGAYQESLGGYGGIQHCLTPAPRHLIIDRDEQNNLNYRVFADEQTAESMMKILGY
jgi:arginine decarboxylase